MAYHLYCDLAYSLQGELAIEGDGYIFEALAKFLHN